MLDLGAGQARKVARGHIGPPSSGQPLAVPKWLLVRPSRRACAFICPTKASSVPAIHSASTTDASLPDRVMMPCSKFSTLTCS